MKKKRIHDDDYADICCSHVFALCRTLHSMPSAIDRLIARVQMVVLPSSLPIIDAQITMRTIKLPSMCNTFVSLSLSRQQNKRKSFHRHAIKCNNIRSDRMLLFPPCFNSNSNLFSHRQVGLNKTTFNFCPSANIRALTHTHMCCKFTSDWVWQSNIEYWPVPSSSAPKWKLTKFPSLGLVIH